MRVCARARVCVCVCVWSVLCVVSETMYLGSCVYVCHQWDYDPGQAAGLPALRQALRRAAAASASSLAGSGLPLAYFLVWPMLLQERRGRGGGRG